MKEKEIPLWHQEIIRERLELYEANPEQVLDSDTVIAEIEKFLDEHESKRSVKGTVTNVIESANNISIKKQP